MPRGPLGFAVGLVGPGRLSAQLGVRPGAHVRSGYANAELLVVDRYYVVNGPLIGVQSMPDGMDPTFAFTGNDYANSLVTIFIEQYNGAAPYDPREVAQ